MTIFFTSLGVDEHGTEIGTHSITATIQAEIDKYPLVRTGVIAITALETGSSLSSPLVKACILVGAPILIVTTADASLRIWRSAWAWLPVDRGRGLFRFAWLGAAAIGIMVFAGFAAAALVA